MKKIYLFVLCIIMFLNLAACTSSGKDTGRSADIKEESSQKTDMTTGDAGTAGTRENGTTPVDMGNEDNTRITIALSKPQNRFIDAAARKFMDINSGITVEVKYYTSMGERLTRTMEDGSMVTIGKNTDPGGEKFVKTISTELMSGAGPDIIDTLYIPCGQFADNGFLCNLRDVMGQDAGFNKSDYLESILDSAGYKGGLYSMPIGFLTDLLAGRYGLPLNVDLESMTFDRFLESAGEALKSHGFKEPYALASSEETLFNVLFKRNYDMFINEEGRKCDFTSGGFVKLLNQISTAADEKLIFKAGDELGKFKGLDNLFFLMESSYDSNYLAYCKEPAGANNVYAIPDLNGKPGIGADVFESYGINSNSDSKGAAWKFLKFLVSEEMQTSPEFFIFPVNKSAMMKKIDRERVSKSGYISSTDDPIFKRITLYPFYNRQIMKIVEEETKKFFDGQKSADDTARVIQSRVDMVVKE